MVSPKGIRNLLRRTRSWTLPLSTAQNCAGCHGAQGRGGAAIALADPVYLAIVDEDAMRKVIAERRSRNLDAGLRAERRRNADGQTDRCDYERNILALGTQRNSRREQSAFLCGKNSGQLPRHGELVYGTYCASCHGPGGQGGPKGSAITNDSFLALVSDQGLRTIVIAGRPELGAPDWRGNVPGKPMSDQEITDVVAWLASRRVQNPGQPYSASNYAQH